MTNSYDLEKAKRLKSKARRTIKIIDNLLLGMTLPEIRKKYPQIPWTLIDWYIKALTKTPDALQNSDSGQKPV